MFDWLRRLLGAAGGAVNNAVNTAGRFVQQNNPVNQWQQVQRQLPQVQRQIQRQIQPYIPRIQPPTPPPQLRQIQNLNIPRLANISADTARNVLGNIGKGYTNFAKQQEAKFRSDINLARNNPATFAVSKTPLLGAVAPFLDTSPVKLPKVDFTGYVDRSGDRIANTNVGRNPIVGFAGQNIVKPIIRSGARVADVMQGQEQYAPGIKGIAQLSTDAFNVGSLAYTPAKAGQLALGGKAALRVAPSAALRGAGAGAGISTLNQYADTGRINPTDVALSGLLGGVANVALPVAGGYAGRGLQRAGTAVKPVARELRLDTGGFAKLPGKNNPIDPLEALKAEARKYKSAEEFVKAQGDPLLHGTTRKFDAFDISKAGTRNPNDQGFAGKGIYLTNSKQVAETFAAGKDVFTTKSRVEANRIVDSYLDKDARILDVKDFKELADKMGLPDSSPRTFQSNADNIATRAREQGYDAIRVDGGGKDKYGTKTFELAVLNPDKIKTKQQLTDLYNQANAPVGKYKTVHQGGKSVQVDGEPIKIADGLDTFIHKDENGNWVVSEATTGRSLTGGGYENKTFAIKAARDVVMTNGVDNVKKRVAEVAPQVGKTDPLEALKAEARKYKSADEFVKAQGEPVYHRSPNKFSEFDISKVSNDTNRQRGGWGLYFSDAVDAIPEDAYGKYLYEVQAPKGTLLDTKNPVDEKIVSKIVDAVRVNGKNPSELSEFSYNGYLFYKTLSRILGGDKEASLFLSKNGIDGLKRTISPTANDYILFNDKSIKTKQQLTDLYNQATKRVESKAVGEVKYREVKMSSGLPNTKLPDVLDNPALYKKYPELRNADIRFGSDKSGILSGGSSGSHMDMGNRSRIEIGRDGWEYIYDTKKIATLEKQLQSVYAKAKASGLSEAEMQKKFLPTINKIGNQIDDLQTPKNATGKRLTEGGQSALIHEIEHAKQKIKGVDMSHSGDYANRQHEIDAFNAQSKHAKNKPIDPLESLKAEARKYKSAEEFVQKNPEAAKQLNTDYQNRLTQSREISKNFVKSLDQARKQLDSPSDPYYFSIDGGKKATITRIQDLRRYGGDIMVDIQVMNGQKPGNRRLFNDEVFQLVPHGKIRQTKSPVGMVDNYVQDPNMEKLFKSIPDELKSGTIYPGTLENSSRLNKLVVERQLDENINQIKKGQVSELSSKRTNRGLDSGVRTDIPASTRSIDSSIPNRMDNQKLSSVTDLYNQATAPQVGKTTQATLKQANELVEPQATQLDRMGTVSAPQTLSKTGVDISSQADNTPISLKIKGQMSDANYLKRFGKEREAVKIKIKPFTPEDYAFERWKDRGALSLGRETLERNLDRVAGKDAPKVKKFLVEQSRNNEFQRAQFLNSKRGEVKNYIVDQLGIKPRSKESALVQKYGEGLIDDVQLNQEAGARAPQIAEAASYFRSQYDELLDQWNAVRTRYGYDEVPKRQDYFRHFKEINDNIMQLGMIPKSRDLPTSISGITDIFRPNKPFSNAELRRYTNETTFDAVGGFDNYLDSVSRQIFHTDTVQRGRYVENAIRKQAEDNPEIELPNFVANLGEWTNLVSGKKTRIDRASEQLLGRKVYGLMDALRRKTSANMVGANLSSAMSNFIPFTQSISTTSKPSVIKGMMSSATSPLRGDVNSIDGEVSSYLTRRFAKDAIVKVKGAKAADIASTPFKWVDEFTSRSIVAGKYYENLSKGLNSKEAMKAADDYASKVITDRSIGQLPNLMNTKTIGFITQFQAEINNQVSFLMRDIPELAGGNKVKIANMLGQFVVFSYLFNTGYEKVMGRRPQIDPIQAGIDMYQALNADNDDTTSEKVISGLKKAGDRIATGLPFVSVFTGGRLPVNAMLPDVPALTKGIGSIGSPEGTQWGQFYKGVSGPAFYRLPPFGGGQAKKTLEGLYSYSKGESTTPAGRQRFEVAQTPANLAKSLVFGQYSTDEGKQYIKQLGENQSGQGGGSKDKEYLKAFDAGERKFLSMTKKEQEEYLKQDQRFNGTKEKYRIWKIDQEGIDLPEGISDQSRDVLTQLAKTSERDKKAFKDKNLYAVELAEYEKDKLEGKLNDIEDGKRVKSLQRNKVYNDFDPLVRDLYSLNKTEFFRYIKNNPNGKALFAQAVALDDALVAIGLKSKLRNKYGQILEPGVRVARAKKGRSKKGGGKGRKGGVAKTGVVRLKSPKLRLSMSVVPPKVGKVSLKTSPKLRPASAKPLVKLSRVGSVKVRSNA